MDTASQLIWTKDRIQKLIDDQIEEGPNLDYKAAGSLEKSEPKKAEITKDASAFANADGRTIKITPRHKIRNQIQ